jgi:hypothetical protein
MNHEDLRRKLARQFKSEVIVAALISLARQARRPGAPPPEKLSYKPLSARRASRIIKLAGKLKLELQDNLELSVYAARNGKHPDPVNYGIALGDLIREATRIMDRLPKGKGPKGPPVKTMLHEIAKRTGRILAENGVKLTIYDDGDFGAALDWILEYVGHHTASRKDYLTGACEELSWEENFITQYPEAQRQQHETIRQLLPRKFQRSGITKRRPKAASSY